MAITAQEIFNRVVERLLDDTGQAIGTNTPTACCYRTETDLKCAVGIFIPDDAYDEAGMEGRDVEQLFNDYKHEAWVKELRPHLDLLEVLQLIHDQKDNWEGTAFTRTDIICDVAKKYNLALPQPLRKREPHNSAKGKA